MNFMTHAEALDELAPKSAKINIAVTAAFLERMHLAAEAANMAVAVYCRQRIRQKSGFSEPLCNKEKIKESISSKYTEKFSRIHIPMSQKLRDHVVQQAKNHDVNLSAYVRYLLVKKEI